MNDSTQVETTIAAPDLEAERTTERPGPTESQISAAIEAAYILEAVRR